VATLSVFLPVAFMVAFGAIFQPFSDGGCFYHILYPGGAYHDPNDRAYFAQEAQ